MIDLEPYIPLARGLASEFFLPGAERDDIEQEALLALVLAARAFDPKRGVSFRSFAKVVIRRRLQTAVTTARRQKHLLLTEAVRSVRDERGQRFDAVDVVASRDPDTHELYEIRARLAELVRGFHEDLSQRERAAVVHIFNGNPYVGDKATDNALCRARRKLAA